MLAETLGAEVELKRTNVKGKRSGVHPTLTLALNSARPEHSCLKPSPGIIHSGTQGRNLTVVRAVGASYK